MNQIGVRESDNVDLDMGEQKLTKPWSIRLSTDDVETLDDLAERTSIPRLMIARMAMRIGLAIARKDPGKLLMAGTPTRRRRKRPRGRG